MEDDLRDLADQVRLLTRFVIAGRRVRAARLARGEFARLGLTAPKKPAATDWAEHLRVTRAWEEAETAKRAIGRLTDLADGNENYSDERLAWLEPDGGGPPVKVPLADVTLEDS